MRRKAAEAETAEPPGAASSSEASETAAPSRCSPTWAMLIKRVYEIDPLRLPEVPGPNEGGRFHRAAARGRQSRRFSATAAYGIRLTPRAPPSEDGWVHEPDADWDSLPASSEQSGELTFVDMDEFLATL
ncbi:MAG: hypothetical protein U1E05_12880 [Patescibacteria group bacterium]|nr:hypothetical protein [Patescibacteria group bacterium]